MLTIYLWCDVDGWYWSFQEDRVNFHGPYKTEGVARGVARNHWNTVGQEHEFIVLETA